MASTSSRGDAKGIDAAPSATIYMAVRFFLTCILKIFFREVETRGAHNIPKEGPVLFLCGPHANQYVDSLIVCTQINRVVSFLMAEKTLREPVVGELAKAMHAIPVIRPQDLAINGDGTVRFPDPDPEKPSKTLVGIDTKFKIQVQLRDKIALKTSPDSFEVVEIISDTELKLRSEPSEKAAVAAFSSAGGTPYRIIPHVDQHDIYARIWERLADNGAVAIFPEGGSHDQPELLPFKAGFTIFTLGAMAAHPGLEVKIVPVGLNYFHPDKFRSRCVVDFGHPLSISSELVEAYKKGGAEKRDACGKLLTAGTEALKNVTVNAPNYETLMVIQAARRLYQPATLKLPLVTVVELNRRFVYGCLQMQNEPEFKELKTKVAAYNRLLKYYGLRDHQVKKTALGGWRSARLLVQRVAVLLFVGMLAMPGAIINLPIALTAIYFSQKKQKAALASSVVKLRARDVVATWKVVVALGLGPVLYFLYALSILIWGITHNKSTTWNILVPLSVWIALPFFSYASVRVGEVGMDVLRSLPPLFVTIGQPQAAENLRQIRATLSQDITKAINRLAPRVYDDFDPDRWEKIARQQKVTSTSTAEQADKVETNENETNMEDQAHFWTTDLGSASNPLDQLRSVIQSHKDWIDDTMFNWNRHHETDDEDTDVLFDTLEGALNDKARRDGYVVKGKHAETIPEQGESTPSSSQTPRKRERKRTSSLGASLADGGLKVSALANLDREKGFGQLHQSLVDQQDSGL
ncbi:hypothetical protein BZG36_03683 [Bifiguratus adelaidae]|uniref:Phospholipid/glycerol acyltransferase domain-containing protein n=1 Tax=Bifiguratus adelaidae TaxID=1938954 RepID=A0A261XZS8_9FUNG|nr:hypothetical protein BZG36_03683 [Bifiguratus adelaidae]